MGQSRSRSTRMRRVFAWSLIAVSLAATGYAEANAQDTTQRARFIQAAKSMSYGRPAASAACGSVGIAIDLPSGYASVSAADLRRGRTVARIYSTDAMPQLGLGAGWNFLRVDYSGNRWRMLTIPEDPAARMSAREIQMLSDPGGHAFSDPIIQCPVGEGAGGGFWFKCGNMCCCSTIFECVPPARWLEILRGPRPGYQFDWSAVPPRGLPPL